MSQTLCACRRRTCLQMLAVTTKQVSSRRRKSERDHSAVAMLVLSRSEPGGRNDPACYRAVTRGGWGGVGCLILCCQHSRLFRWVSAGTS